MNKSFVYLGQFLWKSALYIIGISFAIFDIICFFMLFEEKARVAAVFFIFVSSGIVYLCYKGTRSKTKPENTEVKKSKFIDKFKNHNIECNHEKLWDYIRLGACRECYNKYKQGIEIFKYQLRDSLYSLADVNIVYDKINKIKQQYCISDVEFSSLIRNYLIDYVDDNLLSIEENDEWTQYVPKFINKFSSYLDSDIKAEIEDKIKKYTFLSNYLKHGSFSKSDLLYNGEVPIILKKDEQIIYKVCAIYHLLKEKKHYEGGSTGYSVRVMKGVYLRQNSFKGYPVVSKELSFISSGNLYITDRNIYYYSTLETKKFDMTKILSLTEDMNGFLFSYCPRTKTEEVFFQIIDTEKWFVYNLIKVLLDKVN